MAPPLRIVREAAYLQPLFVDSSEPHTEESMAAKLLMALRSGHILVCRKATFIESMLDGGALLCTSRPSLAAWDEVMNGLPVQHRESLRRRVRLIVKIDGMRPGLTLRVYDSGPHGRSWH